MRINRIQNCTSLQWSSRTSKSRSRYQPYDYSHNNRRIRHAHNSSFQDIRRLLLGMLHHNRQSTPLQKAHGFQQPCGHMGDYSQSTLSNKHLVSQACTAAAPAHKARFAQPCSCAWFLGPHYILGCTSVAGMASKHNCLYKSVSVTPAIAPTLRPARLRPSDPPTSVPRECLPGRAASRPCPAQQRLPLTVSREGC